MHSEESIQQLGGRLRMALWIITALTLACTLGLPSMADIELEVINNNVLLNSFFFLQEALLPLPEELQTGITLSALQQFLVLAIFLISSGLLLAVVWQIDRLFALYQQGEVFSHNNVQRFNTIGVLLIAVFFFELIAGNIMNDWLTTYAIAEFEDQIASGEITSESLFDDTEWNPLTLITLNLSLLLSGLFMVLVAKVMALGVNLQSEVDATV